MGVEHVGRQPAGHRQAVRPGQALVEAQRGDPRHLAERGREFGVRRVVEPALEGRQDRIEPVPAHADDEREAEPGVVGVVQAVEARVLGVGQPVEPGAGLLGGGVGGQVAFPRRLAGEVGVAAHQRQPALRRGVADRGGEGVAEGGEGGERPAPGDGLGDPGRVLEDALEGGDEAGGVEPVEVVEGQGGGSGGHGRAFNAERCRGPALRGPSRCEGHLRAIEGERASGEALLRALEGERASGEALLRAIEGERASSEALLRAIEAERA